MQVYLPTCPSWRHFPWYSHEYPIKTISNHIKPREITLNHQVYFVIATCSPTCRTWQVNNLHVNAGRGPWNRRPDFQQKMWGKNREKSRMLLTNKSNTMRKHMEHHDVIAKKKWTIIIALQTSPCVFSRNVYENNLLNRKRLMVCKKWWCLPTTQQHIDQTDPLVFLFFHSCSFGRMRHIAISLMENMMNTYWIWLHLILTNPYGLVRNHGCFQPEMEWVPN